MSELLEEVWHATARAPRPYPGAQIMSGYDLGAEILGSYDDVFGAAPDVTKAAKKATASAQRLLASARGRTRGTRVLAAKVLAKAKTAQKAVAALKKPAAARTAAARPSAARPSGLVQRTSARPSASRTQMPRSASTRTTRMYGIPPQFLAPAGSGASVVSTTSMRDRLDMLQKLSDYFLGAASLSDLIAQANITANEAVDAINANPSAPGAPAVQGLLEEAYADSTGFIQLAAQDESTALADFGAFRSRVNEWTGKIKKAVSELKSQPTAPAGDGGAGAGAGGGAGGGGGGAGGGGEGGDEGGGAGAGGGDEGAVRAFREQGIDPFDEPAVPSEYYEPTDDEAPVEVETSADEGEEMMPQLDAEFLAQAKEILESGEVTPEALEGWDFDANFMPTNRTTYYLDRNAPEFNQPSQFDQTLASLAKLKDAYKTSTPSALPSGWSDPFKTSSSSALPSGWVDPFLGLDFDPAFIFMPHLAAQKFYEERQTTPVNVEFRTATPVIKVPAADAAKLKRLQVAQKRLAEMQKKSADYDRAQKAKGVEEAKQQIAASRQRLAEAAASKQNTDGQAQPADELDSILLGLVESLEDDILFGCLR